MLNLDKSTWTRHRLGDVATLSKEKVDPTDGTVERFVAGEHMDSNELRISRWGNVGDGYLGPAFHRRFRPGQVLYGSRRTYLRKVAVADFDGVCANTTFVLNPVESNISRRFLPFLMSSEPFHAFAIAESRGSVNPYVNWSDIAKFEVKLPPLTEQEQLADLLWAVESLSVSQAEAVQAAQKAMNLWLDLRVDSAPMRPLPDLTSEPTKNGLSIAETTACANRTTVSISAVRDGRIANEGCLKDIQVDEDRARPFTMRAGDFFVVRGNGNRDLVARGGLLESEADLPSGTIYPDLLMRVRFDDRVMIPKFGAAVWNLDRVHQALASKAKSTNGTWKINGKDLASHRLPSPTLGAQTAVVATLDHWRRAIATKRSERLSCYVLKTSLLQEIFGGVS